MSVVLENHQDPNYEPTQAEIVEYGKWLGLELPADNSLLRIARDGLKAPLPENWKACKSEKGELYYFNFKTGQSLWDHPMDEHFKSLFKKEKAKLIQNSGSSGGGMTSQRSTSSGDDSSPHKDASTNSNSAVRTSRTKRRKDDGGAVTISIKPQQEPHHLVPPLTRTTTSDNNELSIISNPGGSAATGESGTEDETSSNKSSSKSSSKLHALKTLKVKKDVPLDAPVKAPAELNAIDLKLAPLSLGNGKTPLGSLGTTKTATSVAPSKFALDDVHSTLGAKHVSPILMQTPVALQETGSMSMSSNDTPRSASAGSSAKRRSVSFLSQDAKDAVTKEMEALLAKFKEDEDLRISGDKEDFTRSLEMALKKAKNVAKLQHTKELNQLERELTAKLEEEKQKLLTSFNGAVQLRIQQEKESVDSATTKFRRDVSESIIAEMEAATAEFFKSVDGKYSTLFNLVKRQSEVVELERSMQSQHDARVVALQQQNQSELANIQTRHAQTVEEANASIVAHTRLHEQEEASLMEHQRQRLAELAELHAAELDLTKAQFRASALSELEQIKAEMCIAAASREGSQKNSNYANETARPHLSTAAAHDALVAGATMESEDDDSLKDFADALLASYSDAHSAPLPLARKSSGGAANMQQMQHADRNEKAKRESGIRPAQQSHNMPQPLQTEDLRTVVTEVLREVFKNSPFITGASPTAIGSTPMPAEINSRQNSGVFGRDVTNAVSGVSVSAKKTEAWTNTTANSNTNLLMCSPGPGSYQEQKKLLADERQRMEEAQAFVMTQRENLELRAAQLKSARKNWKSDVIAAKAQGISATSRKGLLLQKVHSVLDKQAQGLTYDENLLVDSEEWLRSKEQRLVRLEEQMDEHERSAIKPTGLDMSATSVDTALLITGFFKPAPQQRSTMELIPAAAKPNHTPSSRKHSSTTAAVLMEGAAKSAKSQDVGSADQPQQGRSLSPLLSKALERIEQRLDHVTNMMSHKAAKRHEGKESTHRSTSAEHPPRPSSRSRSANNNPSTARSSIKSKHVDFAVNRPFSDQWSDLGVTH